MPSFPMPARRLPLAASALLVAACAGSKPSLPDPTAKHLEYAEANGFPSSTLQSLKHGKRLYLNRCSSCHELYQPGKYAPAEWPSIMEDMRVNAEIDPSQVREITRYVVAMSAAVRDTAAPRPMGAPQPESVPAPAPAPAVAPVPSGPATSPPEPASSAE